MKFLNGVDVEDGHIQLSDTYKIQWGGSNARIDGSNASDYIRLWTSDTERMRITSAGNVGIGTASPAADLHIKDSTQNSSITDTIPSWWSGVFERSYTTSSLAAVALVGGTQATGSAGALYFGYSNDVDNNYIMVTGGDMQFGVNTAEKMRITSAGNVGIGTTSPAAKLDVKGVAIIDGGTGVSSSGVLHVRQNGDGSSSGIALTSSYAASHRIWKDANGKLNFGPSSLPSAFVQDLSGNVGIGTTSPSKKLHIALSNSAHADEGIILDSSSGYGQGLITHDYNQGNGITAFKIANGYTGSQITLSQDSYSSTGSPGSVRIYTSPSGGANTPIERMRITADGNLGIGTASPSQKLHVVGNATVTGVIYTNIVQTLGGTSIDFRHQDASTIMRVDTANARVGIGTTSPSQKLEVSGNIKLSTSADKIMFGSGGTSPAWSAPQVFRSGSIMAMSDYSGVQLGGYDGAAYGPRFYVKGGGQVQMFSYDSTNQTGTPTYLLGTDASGNVVKTLGGGIPGGPYLPLAGGTITGNVKFNDSIYLQLGSSGDLQVYHDGTNSVLNNLTGNLQFYNNANGKDIEFISDDGSGGSAIYMFLDGSQTNVNFQKDAIWADSKKALFGGSGDLQIYHDGSNSYIKDTGAGDLYIQASDNVYFQTYVSGKRWITLNENASVDLFYNDSKKFETTNTGVTVTGGWVTDGVSVATANVEHTDNTKSLFGNGNDLQIYHNATDSVIENSTGDLYIKNTADDKDIIFQSDDGSGGLATYFFVDTASDATQFTKTVYLQDNVKAQFGNSSDLKIYHDGSNSYINETGTGVLSIQSDGTEVQINKGASEYMGRFITDAGVKLYYDNSLKFETTSTGVQVTGKITNLTAGTSNLDAVNVQQLNNATTGTLIYKGTWSAAPTTTSVLDGAISSAGTIVIDAANPGISVGATITGTGISGTVTVSNIAADGITIAISSAQTIANGVTLTFTTVGGTPDLSQASRKVTGHYYICETAGAATPNGAGTTPNEWAVGDWATFSDLTTDAWQKIDNSSVLSGAGTGGKVPVWSGAGTSVTLADAPITVSGNNATFAGNVAMASGNATGKFAVKSTGVHASYDFYNNGTSYFNGGVTVDAGLSQTGGAAATFSGIVGVGSTGVYAGTNAALNLPGKGIALKNDKDGSNNNWSYINNTATAGTSNINFATGQASSALTLAHNGNATFSGNVTLSSTAPVLYLANTTPSTGKTWRFSSAANGNAYITQDGVIDAITLSHTSGNATFAGNIKINGGTDAGSQLSLFADSNGHTSLAGYTFEINTGNNNSRTRSFYIDNSKNATFAGDVKIPIAGKIEGSTYPYTTNIGSGANATTTNITAGSTDKSEISLIGGDVGDRIEFKTNSTERMRIDSSGNLLVGTTSATATDGSNIELSSATSSRVILDSTGTGGRKWTMATGLDGRLDFYDYDASSYRMSIDNSGNVGIGTAAPAAKLHISGATDESIIRLQNTATSLSLGDTIGALQFYNSDTTDDSPNIAASIYATAGPSGGSGYLSFRTKETGTEGDAATATMTLTNGGNVGIGKTDPSAPLHINGGSTNQVVKIQSNSTPYVRFKEGGTDVGFIQFGTDTYISNQKAGTLNFRTNNTDKMTILSDGNVGIGTTSPGEKLEVDGNVKADNFIGGNEAGIYTFSDTVDASSSEDIFSISCTNGASAFRATFVCSTSGYSVAKTFEVVKAHGADPVFFKVVDTGAYTHASADHDFDVSFTNDATDDTKVVCEITNNSTTINANIVSTVFLGGSPTTITVTAL